MKISALLFFLSVTVFAQTDWERWKATEPDYKIDSPYESTRLYEKTSPAMVLLSTIRNGYAFFISDLDGDNCPFYPSCSRFFVLSVKETDFLNGILMFADRFTRDSNLFKNRKKYRLHKSGKFYDPVYLYTLNAENLEEKYLQYINAH